MIVHWLAHQLHAAENGAAYQFWSGIGSDLGELTIIVAIGAVLRRHQCHVRWCPRLAWKSHGDHELCRRHHPKNPPGASDIPHRKDHMPTTQGVSPKTLAAGFAPVAGGLLVALVNYAITGQFDGTSLAAVVAGSGGGVVSTIAAYIAKPGPVHEIAVNLEPVAKADPALTAEAKAFIRDELAKLPVGLQPVEKAVEDLIPPDIAQTLADPALDQPGYVDPTAQALLLSSGHTHLGDVPPPTAPIPAPIPPVA